MSRKPLRFRQIQFDFHTAGEISGIGTRFDKSRWQETLTRARVNSANLFSKCHHGWSYHPTAVGKTHPHLEFDLLRAQVDACREVGIETAIYLSAGLDNLAGAEHPEWRSVGPDGRYTGRARSVTDAGFFEMCFQGPYLDYLCAQIAEAVRLFPGASGVFLDIISENPCCCRWCLEAMERHSLDPSREADRQRCAAIALQRYYERTTSAVKNLAPETAVFHNSGHITRGRRDVLKFQSHLELESLPTGGWGYDHFPVSAKYCANLDHEFLGMTAKFHTTWGEFGGYKHPNALRYECAAMLAYGAKCSVGDQLHPDGSLDGSTFEIIGAAYREVETKEPWCEGAVNVADIGVLSSEAEHPDRPAEAQSDTGACRLLLEGHLLFTVLDRTMDFSPLKMVVLPDDIPVDGELKSKLAAFLHKGGKLLLTGESGLSADGGGFAFDIGATWGGGSEYVPDYVLPAPGLRASFLNSPLVMYLRSQRITVTDGESLGDVYDPYFNRAFDHFCGHQHAPARPGPSGFASGVRKGNILYLAHPVFAIYRALGGVAYKEITHAAIRHLLGGDAGFRANLPSTARVSLMRQPARRRTVLHLLHASTITRGGEMELNGGTLTARTKSVEVIEDLLPLHDVFLTLQPRQPVARVTLEPQGVEIPHGKNRDGSISLSIPSFTGHQMVVFHDA